MLKNSFDGKIKQKIKLRKLTWQGTYYFLPWNKVQLFYATKEIVQSRKENHQLNIKKLNTYRSYTEKICLISRQVRKYLPTCLFNIVKSLVVEDHGKTHLTKRESRFFLKQKPKLFKNRHFRVSAEAPLPNILMAAS